MMGIGEGWGFAIDAGVFNMMQSRSRHSDGKSAFDTKRDWELIVIDIIDISEIEEIINETRALMFNDAERDLRYFILEYPTFTVLHIPLSNRRWHVSYGKGKDKEVKELRSTTEDQIVFCTILIALLRDHLIDLGEHVLKTSEVKPQ